MSRRKTARLGVAIVGVLLSLACVEETPALFIVHNSALDEECEPITRGNPLEFRGAGTMDLTVASTYTMFPLVENLMSPSGSVTLGGSQGGGTSTTGGQYEGNRVTLTSASASFKDVPAGVSIGDIPRIPLSGTLEPNGDVVTSLRIIDEARASQFDDVLAERGEAVTIEVRLRFRGVSTSGTEVESNLFTYPLTICRGCLLSFPLDANDPLEPQPNCRADFTSDDSSLDEFDLSCFPGQDNPLDCRVCRILKTAQGSDSTQVERACEPAPET